LPSIVVIVVIVIAVDVSIVDTVRHQRQPSSWLSLWPPSSTSAIIAVAAAINIDHRYGHCHRQRQRGHIDVSDDCCHDGRDRNSCKNSKGGRGQLQQGQRAIAMCTFL